MLADRLKPGDEIRIIAPSRSMVIMKSEQVRIAEDRLNSLGFIVTYGKNVEAHDEFFSSTIEERVEDLHDAFTDPNVKGVLTVTGGYNVNQILTSIDFNLIKKNPKIFCGYSDITALSNAIYSKTGLITYSGPHFSSFGVKHGFDYTLAGFLEAVTTDEPYEVEASTHWSDDPWYLNQEDRTFNEDGKYMVLQEGEAEGTLIGGNLSTINLLQGTEFMPSLKDCILFIEDDEESHALTFDRNLQSLLHQPDADAIRGILIGRFQDNSQITEAALRKIIASKKELKGVPIIANVNFGHVQPIATIPLGGHVSILAKQGETEIFIDQRPK